MSFGVATAPSIARKGAVAGAKVLAASVVDFLTDPKLVEEAKTTFKKETAGFQYKSFLPLSKYYLKEKPKFE